MPWALHLGQKVPLSAGDAVNPAPAGGAVRSRIQAAARRADRDGDGLPDALEDELLRRYAPTLLLAYDDPSLPASIDWLRQRATLGRELREDGRKSGRLLMSAKAFDIPTRRGSDDPADWTVYGHVFPLAEGGIALQYWSFYPYNEGPLFFDHDGDWEHVTVGLDEQHQPTWMAFARHSFNAPGRKVPWAEVPREGNHPFVLVARGTHAAYVHPSEAPRWERLPQVDYGPDGAPKLLGAKVRVWRPGSGPGRSSPLVNVGERGAPRLEAGADGFFMQYAGLWGMAATIIGTAVPPGPPYQRGFCAGARPGGCP